MVKPRQTSDVRRPLWDRGNRPSRRRGLRPRPVYDKSGRPLGVGSRGAMTLGRVSARGFAKEFLSGKFGSLFDKPLQESGRDYGVHLTRRRSARSRDIPSLAFFAERGNFATSLFRDLQHFTKYLPSVRILTGMVVAAIGMRYFLDSSLLGSFAMVALAAARDDLFHLWGRRDAERDEESLGHIRDLISSDTQIPDFINVVNALARSFDLPDYPLMLFFTAYGKLGSLRPLSTEKTTVFLYDFLDSFRSQRNQFVQVNAYLATFEFVALPFRELQDIRDVFSMMLGSRKIYEKYGFKLRGGGLILPFGSAPIEVFGQARIGDSNYCLQVEDWNVDAYGGINFVITNSQGRGVAQIGVIFDLDGVYIASIQGMDAYRSEVNKFKAYFGGIDPLAFLLENIASWAKSEDYVYLRGFGYYYNVALRKHLDQGHFAAGVEPRLRQAYESRYEKFHMHGVPDRQGMYERRLDVFPALGEELGPHSDTIVVLMRKLLAASVLSH